MPSHAPRPAAADPSALTSPRARPSGGRGPSGGRRVRRTPEKLRWALASCVLACLLLSVLALLAGLLQSSHLRGAEQRTTEVADLLEVRSALLAADAQASAEVLAGQSPDQATQGGSAAAIGEATERLAALAGIGRDAAITTAVGLLPGYAGLVDVARATDDPALAAARLEEAAQRLNGEILPALDAAVDSLTASADAQLGTVSHLRALAFVAIAPLAWLVVVQVWLARRTHRVFNLPLVAGTLAGGLALAGTVTMSVSAGTRALAVHDGAATTAGSLATPAVAMAWVAAALGLLGAGLSARGVWIRLAEYRGSTHP